MNEAEIGDFLMTIRSGGRALVERAIRAADGNVSQVSADELTVSFMREYDALCRTYGLEDEGMRQDALVLFQKAMSARLAQ
jgi:hypothetical protein